MCLFFCKGPINCKNNVHGMFDMIPMQVGQTLYVPIAPFVFVRSLLMVNVHMQCGECEFLTRKKLKASRNRSQSSHRTPCHLGSDSNKSAQQRCLTTCSTPWTCFAGSTSDAAKAFSVTWQRMHEGASLAFAWDNNRIISAASSLQHLPVSMAKLICSGLTLPPPGMPYPCLPALSGAPHHHVSAACG